jgi:serine/threonine protein kinase
VPSDPELLEKTGQPGSWSEEERLELTSEQSGEESHIIGDRYRITEGLALGGMGAVFKVSHIHLGKTFALKIILMERASDPRIQQYFFREARVLSQLSHPNIVQITDFGHDARFGSFLVMEYLHGETLFDRLQREERLLTGLALQIGLQLAEALDFMHSRSLIHCDIKPENVFLCREVASATGGEAVKLIDFGLSRSMVPGGGRAKTQVGGTPAYAAPEQLAGQAPQPTMDIYGVGVLLYAMITGWPPFTGSMDEVLEAKRTRDPVAPSERLGRKLDPALEALLVRCLARSPALRPVSMSQLIAELRGLLVRMGYTVPESSIERARPITGKHAALGTGAHLTLDRCPIPLFVLDPQGHIENANPTFAQALETPSEALIGRLLTDTRLGRLYPELLQDLSAARERGLSVLRRIDFESRGAPRTSVFLWLAPEISEEGSVQRFWGMLMPV